MTIITQPPMTTAAANEANSHAISHDEGGREGANQDEGKEGPKEKSRTGSKERKRKMPSLNHSHAPPRPRGAQPSSLKSNAQNPIPLAFSLSLSFQHIRQS